eukprot:GHVT01054305.1.p1 GENE.GHVT01054305.1~~GHVT01054305.1.p1  ORF type:complete len:208 (+),score=12.79 GHVT01054305.1:826-1449(+)
MPPWGPPLCTRNLHLPMFAVLSAVARSVANLTSRAARLPMRATSACATYLGGIVSNAFLMSYPGQFFRSAAHFVLVPQGVLHHPVNWVMEKTVIALEFDSVELAGKFKAISPPKHTGPGLVYFGSASRADLGCVGCLRPAYRPNHLHSKVRRHLSFGMDDRQRVSWSSFSLWHFAQSGSRYVVAGGCKGQDGIRLGRGKSLATPPST